jgi:small nuclear ribonucleoprotein (snRNP)-like protein
MEESKDAYKREYRNVTIRTIDGSTLLGKINIGIKERVSDLFTKTESQFIVLLDVEHRDISGKVLFINKNNIVWVEPED